VLPRVAAAVLLAFTSVLASEAPARAPARAAATASIVTGDLGTVGGVRAEGDETKRAGEGYTRDGLEVDGGRATATASRAGGDGVARATARADGVSLLDGLIAADRVTRTARADGGRGPRYGGAITGLVVDGEPQGDLSTRRDPLAPGPDGSRRRPRRGAEARLMQGDYVFPVFGSGAHCADDWGGARQIGPHQGNDCFAPFGTPVLAVADGTLNRVGTLPISGNRLWLRSDDGDSFFYAHLSAFAPEAVDGAEVKAGTLLGFTGNTGDAEPTPPHVHFEIHPGADDDKAIDPHAILLAWQRDGRPPTGGWIARYGTDTEERPGALVEVRDFIDEG
jgi:murein DD-endopeptidase MepM/ murein hydrolase activator NlpD